MNMSAYKSKRRQLIDGLDNYFILSLHCAVHSPYFQFERQNTNVSLDVKNFFQTKDHYNGTTLRCLDLS